MNNNKNKNKNALICLHGARLITAYVSCKSSEHNKTNKICVHPLVNFYVFLNFHTLDS